DTLLLAARQLRRIMLEPRRQPDALQRILDPLLALGTRKSAIAQRHVDVVEQIEVRNQVEALEHEADLLVAQPRAVLVAELRDVDAVELVLAARGFFEQASDVEERRLAGA